MEIEDKEEEWIDDTGETFEPEEESLNLPAEWLYGNTDDFGQLECPLPNQVNTDGNANRSDIQLTDTNPEAVVQGKAGKVVNTKPRKRGWGPLIPERKSKRVPLDGRTVLEKAQDIKERTTWKLRKVKSFKPNLFLFFVRNSF
jgi:hypothetical protein